MTRTTYPTIKPSELRIGNWYNCANPMEGGRLYPNQFTAWTEYLDFEAYGSPIPLTPEILEKSGFEIATDQYGGWLSPRFGSGSQRRIRLFPDGSYAMLEARLHHLHQLQNLYFAITGTELTINL